jgi:hypothetical protein
VWAICGKRNPVVLCSAYGSVDVGQNVVLSDLHRGRCGREVLVVLRVVRRNRCGCESRSLCCE